MTATSTTGTSEVTSTRGGRQQLGPPLLAPAIAYGVFMLASVLLAGSAPRSTDSATHILDYLRAHVGLTEFVGFLQIAAAIPLAIWAATIYRRLRQLGVTAPGTAIGFAGGVLAAGAMTLLGVLTWSSAAAATAIDAPVAALVANLQFITGTAAFIPALGLLIAGVAVPSFFMRFGPRPFVIFAWVVAAVSLIAVFAMLTPALDFTLPIGRFGGLIAILVFSVVLPKQRSPRQR
ncbi:MAG TPA: DUF4386 domain-containing protein [Pseudonocardiaceae bacterium]